MSSLSSAVGLVLTPLFSPPAKVATPGAEAPEIERWAASKKVLKRGKLQHLRQRKVMVAGKKQVSVGALYDELFADHEALTADLEKGRSGLIADPVVETEVAEFDELTVISSTTSVTVENPDLLPKKSARFKKMRAKNMREGYTRTKMPAEARKSFDTWKARIKVKVRVKVKVKVKKLPRSHPLTQGGRPGRRRAPRRGARRQGGHEGHHRRGDLQEGDHPQRRLGGGRDQQDPARKQQLRLQPELQAGVRADIKIKAKPFINDGFPIGPLWLDALAMDFGTLELPTHEGTKKVYRVKEGEKGFQGLQP